MASETNQILWRWDQGRLEYFQFEEIERIAKAILHLDGQLLPRGSELDTLRIELEKQTSLPFAPKHYKVWRNYKRVFGCQLLAAEISGRLRSTELCKSVASGELYPDSYLFHLARRLYFPAPMFSGYSNDCSRVFPICAAIKCLIAQYLRDGLAYLSVSDILARVKCGGVTGRESLDSFSELRSGEHPADSDEVRQVREMIRFISQFSFLKWDNPNLILDVATRDHANQLFEMFNPIVQRRGESAGEELLSMGASVAVMNAPGYYDGPGLTPVDLEFVDGHKNRLIHVLTERSEKLRDLFYARAKNPSVCAVCESDTLDKYPWGLRIIELHHVMPLAAAVRVEENATSLHDVVGLCPSCHVATHQFLSNWLEARGVDDFISREEAQAAFKMAKAAYAG